MKIRQHILLVILFVLSISNAFAVLDGGWGSGGGKAIVCFDSIQVAQITRNADGVILSEHVGTIASIETLDLYYARNTIIHNQLLRIEASESYIDFLDSMISKIQEADPFFAREILKSKNAFNSRIIGFQHGAVESTHDENYFSLKLPRSCVLTNVAIQKWDENLEGYRLHIDMRLFSHTNYSEENKAVLLLHEYLYQVARIKGATDSRSTRVLISAILNTDPNIDLNEYIYEFSY